MSDFDQMASHQRLLVAAALRTTGPILEMGCGWYSTPLLHEIAAAQGRDFCVTDTDVEWLFKFNEPCPRAHLRLCKTWDPIIEHPLPPSFSVAEKFGLVFVDSAPRESRKALALALLDKTDVFVFHDTEPVMPDIEAYGYDDLLGVGRYAAGQDGKGNLVPGGLGLFPFQHTDKTHPVWTTVASVTTDVRRWFT